MQNEGSYEVCPKIPLTKHTSNVLISLKNCKNLIDKNLANKLSLQFLTPSIPCLDCLLKILKQGKIMCLFFISYVNSSTYLVSKWLVRQFQTIHFPVTFNKGQIQIYTF